MKASTPSGGPRRVRELLLSTAATEGDQPDQGQAQTEVTPGPIVRGRPGGPAPHRRPFGARGVYAVIPGRAGVGAVGETEERALVKDVASASALAKQDGPLADPEQVRTLQQLAQALSLLLAGSGLSVRQVASRTKHDPVPVARETGGKMLRGERLASKAVTLALVTHLGVAVPDLAAWERAWQRAFLDEGGVRTAPPRGQMAELRELVTELRETVQAQQDKLSRLSDQLADLQRSPAGAAPAAASAARLSLTLQMQMEQAAAQVARQTVAELATDLVRRHPKLEVDLLVFMQEIARVAARGYLKELAAEVARRNPNLEMDLLLVMQEAVAPTGREVVREIARGIT